MAFRFSVAPRETKVLIGESGSGKTLILKMAAGLIQPDSGTVQMLGHDLGRMRERELLAFRRKIGFVFQEGALFDSLTVEENVAYCLREEHVSEEEIEPRVRESLRFVEMEDTLEKLPSELSGGMRRRVSIARALVTRPHVVLYDSPTAGLDPVTSQTIITLILRLRDTQGVTSVLATHRLQDAFGLASYRFDGESGRVVPVPHNGASRDSGAATNVRRASRRESLFRRESAGTGGNPRCVFAALFVVTLEDAVREFVEEEHRWRNTNN